VRCSGWHYFTGGKKWKNPELKRVKTQGPVPEVAGLRSFAHLLLPALRLTRLGTVGAHKSGRNELRSAS
jgi:hypothetical protein